MWLKIIKINFYQKLVNSNPDFYCQVAPPGKKLYCKCKHFLPDPSSPTTTTPLTTSKSSIADCVRHFKSQYVKEIFAIEQCLKSFKTHSPIPCYFSVWSRNKVNKIFTFLKALFTQDILTQNILMKRYCAKKIFLSNIARI